MRREVLMLIMVKLFLAILFGIFALVLYNILTRKD